MDTIIYYVLTPKIKNCIKLLKKIINDEYFISYIYDYILTFFNCNKI